MQIILVEDDTFKETMIRAALSDLTNVADVAVVKSVAAAVALLARESFDFIILDVSLPSHDKSKSAPSLQMPSGGLEVLLELAFEQRTERVIIVTQYPEIEFDEKSIPLHKARGTLTSATGVDIRAVIYFDRTDEGWRHELMEAMSSDG